MGEKSEDIYVILRKEYISRMTKEDKEDEMREALKYYYMIL